MGLLKRAQARRARSEIIARLAGAGRSNSDATVLFHAAIARQVGLNPSDYKTMSILEREGRLTAGEISRLTGLATASVTDLIDRLVHKGFVRRVRDRVDRRRILVEPVARKVDEVRLFFASTSKSLSKLYERFSDDELEVIADFLEQNVERLRRETEKIEARSL